MYGSITGRSVGQSLYVSCSCINSEFVMERVISTKLTSGRKRPEYKNTDATREGVSYCPFGCFTSQGVVNLGREVCFMLNAETRWTTEDSQKNNVSATGVLFPDIRVRKMFH